MKVILTILLLGLFCWGCSESSEETKKANQKKESFTGTVHFYSKGPFNPFSPAPDTIHIAYSKEMEHYTNNLHHDYIYVYGSDSVISQIKGERKATLVNSFIGTLDLIEHSKNVDTILDYTVNKLRVSTDEGWTDFYYAPELYLNPDYYKKYRAAKINQVYKIIQAVPLRRVYFSRADSSFRLNEAYAIDTE